jgi:hypothetical protein
MPHLFSRIVPIFFHCRAVMVVGAFGGTILSGSLLYAQQTKEYQSGIVWPQVKVVARGLNAAAPSDAIVLFNGKDLSLWTDGDKWDVQDGCAVSNRTDISTKQAFGDCQLHLEWATPEEIRGKGQGRGNSGIKLMGLYEVQILDSYNNSTYPDGQAGAIYKQQPPLVNASRKPGDWQTFDVIFTAPKFEEDRLVKPAYVTVLHNGVLVQNHFEIQGTTSYFEAPAYKAHPAKLPLMLQYHNNKVRFRNIWIREL